MYLVGATPAGLVNEKMKAEGAVYLEIAKHGGDSHDRGLYPPKMYPLVDLTMVIVAPLPSHSLWNAAFEK